MTFRKKKDYGSVYDRNEDQLFIDHDTGALYADTGEHARTGFDKRFFYGHLFSSVAASSTCSITIETNTKFPHGFFNITSDNEFSYTFELSSATHGDINGTQDYQFNINRGANSERSVASFYYGDTGATAVYKTLEECRVPATVFTTPEMHIMNDWMLDDERIYNLKITNQGDDAAWVCVRYIYHEHDPTSVDYTSVTGNGESATEYSPQL